jgi:alkylation response protein AidB-like acyl-CoA dehydrogenase
LALTGMPVSPAAKGLRTGSPPKVAAALRELRAFCDAHLDPAEIDRRADIPRKVIDGLARPGVLGMTAPESVGGRGFSQLAYCRVLDELGSRCSATSIFVNAHHSIGMRALLLFGTDEQKRRWLPDLVAGKKLEGYARSLASLVRRFGLAVEWSLIWHREEILDRQLVQQPIAEAAMELFASLCVLSRRDAELRGAGDREPQANWEPAAAALFLKQSARRTRECLRRLHDHENEAALDAARRVLEFVRIGP